MSFLNKLAFWKKDDMGLDADLGKDLDFGGGPKGADLGLGPDPMGGGPDLGMGPQGGPDLGLGPEAGPMDAGLGPQAPRAPPMGGFDSPPQRNFNDQPMGAPQGFGAPPPQQAPPMEMNNDKFEVVSAKLDSIRYTLDSINQRISNLERAAYGDHHEPPRY